MPTKSNTVIARKACAKAEADFATWLMMAKLGGFDDLPLNAQSFLINYRNRLERMSEAESTALAVREVYSAYYSEMGGIGAAPEPKARAQKQGELVRLEVVTKPDLTAVRPSTPSISRLIPALLVLAGSLAMILTFVFLAQ